MVFLILGLQLHAQSAAAWDTSGNGLLKGTFYFREAIWVVGDNSGTLNAALAVYGNINFDGNGNYTLSNAALLNSGTLQNNYTATGTYSISASGFGFISPLVQSADFIYGLVSQGIFIGSSTEGGYNNLFIAAPLASPAPTNTFFKGTYWIADFDSPSGSPLDTRDSLFQVNPDGNGNIGSVAASGYIARVGSAVRQNISGVRYSFSNGGANVQFGGSLTSSNLIAGNHYLYFSPDGNFVFGGAPNGWDMMIGVRVNSDSATPKFSGLYYQAGMEQDESTLGNGYANLESYFGSFKAAAGLILSHQRVSSAFDNNPFDYTYVDSYTLKSDGTYDDTFTQQHYIFGASGAIRIGVGNNPTLGLSVAVQAPSFSGPGVFLDPTGIVNSGSSALFTASIVPGELISLYGANLASSARSDSTFPLTLGGVQVMINGRPAQILNVSPERIDAIVPYDTEINSVAGIQVINNSTASNTVTVFTGMTAPGIFTTPPGGIGYAAAQHSADFSLITPSSPAKIGEVIVVYGTGLGALSSVSPGGTTTNTITAAIGGVAAKVGFAGLSVTGLYQINLTVPAGVPAGDNYLDISGPDSFTSEALISIAGTSTAGEISAQARPVRGRRPLSGSRAARVGPKREPVRR